VLNLMGAFNSIILTALATNYGFPAAFGSAVFFAFVFMCSMLFIVDRKSHTALVAHALLARSAPA
jgi:hypothetical protein